MNNIDKQIADLEKQLALLKEQKKHIENKDILNVKDDDIFDEYIIIINLHKIISIAVVFFLAIHIFVYHKILLKKEYGT